MCRITPVDDYQYPNLMIIIMRSLIVCAFLMLSLFVDAQDSVPVSYNMSAIDCSTSIKASNAIKRKRSKSANRGVIVFNGKDNMPEGLRVSFDVVREIWEHILSSEDTVWVNLEYLPNINSDIVVETNYRLANDGIPRLSALHYCKAMNGIRDEKVDATIKIESTIDWVTGFSSYSSGRKNLTLTISRAMGRILGFGTSMFAGRRSLDYSSQRVASIFDRQITNSQGVKMPISSAGGSLDIFFNDNYDDAYVCSVDEAHKLYSTNVFSGDSTFAFLQNGNSIMSIALEDSVEMRIDEVLSGIMQSIGWITDHPQERLIVADDIDSTGVCSAYEQHCFHLSSQCDNPTWKFVLPLNDGTVTTVASASGYSFCIPPMTNEGVYARNVEGDVVGKVELECTRDGSAYSEEYAITLELKPHILDVKLLDVEFLPDYYANYTLGVSYQGCYTLECLLEEEFASGAVQYISKEPFQAILRFSNVDIYGRAWLNLYAWNKYGSDFLSFELPRSESGIADFSLGIDKEMARPDMCPGKVKKILVYDASNTLMDSVRDENELKGRSGDVLILRYIDDRDRVVCTRKTILR